MPTIADAITQAFQAFESGNLEQSEWWCRQALQHDPKRPEILNLVGGICQTMGNSDDAIAWYREAIDANPNYAEAYNNLGVALQSLGHLDIALAQFEAALSLQPKYAQAYFNWGNALSADGQIEEAATAYQRALELQPDYTAARNNLANLMQSIGEYQPAIALYRQSIAQNPDSAIAHMNLANLLQEQGNLDGAMVHYGKAIALDSQNTNLIYNIALAHEKSGNPQQAIHTHYQVLKLNSRHAESHHQLGCLLKHDRPTEALAHLQQAINYQPNLAEAYNSIGGIWHDRMEIPAAIASFQQAINLDPDFADAHLNLATALLLNGDYKSGFTEFEWRWESQTYLIDQLPRHRSMPQWDGTNLQGKTILLWAEQGISETLQFVRYVAEIATRGAEIWLECDPKLVRLFEKLPQIKAIIPRGQTVTPCDYQSSLMSLPKILNTTIETIPASVDLGIPPTVSTSIKKIGLAVSEDCQSDIQSALAAIDGIELIPLSEPEDYAELTDPIANLDLVIATEGPIAHLAASLGQTTWMLLEYAPAWIWLSDRADSPWYPTIEIFRQAQPGDWTIPLTATIEQIHSTS
ncbi:tetratricopeptide repeat protein [filamentous cyanobacterium LEGE 11480]|uniref:Tetratricopeptide repeat protein n=1 Tax=Romeriopsis navalis LEGE 11480 TaxID=2777977 RepID=A0A928VNZ0_9CYAN|nr:tetratricopeptide repeat protein [Romeriopsis navalis]MBE9032016.1 tetratricopeptide repeat protein [Romeriopsis navalis LEGE 11480]